MKINGMESVTAKENLRKHFMNFEQLPCGVAVIKNDAWATLGYANPAFFKVIGYTEKEFWEKHKNCMRDILVDDFLNVVLTHTDGKDCDMEWNLRIRTSEGAIRWIHDVAHYNAEQDEFFVTFIDITAQKKLERKLEAQDTLYNCVETLFTVGSTDRNSEEAYPDILNWLKTYYRANRAFLYKFKAGTYEVESFHEASAPELNKIEISLPMIATEQHVKQMRELSKQKLVKIERVLESLDSWDKARLAQVYLEYEIETFACVDISNTKGEIVAFMGIINPKIDEDSTTLMEILSRYLCMYIEHENGNNAKELALKLEDISKKKIIEMCVTDFHDLTHVKENVGDILNALCHHYDADFAVTLLKQADGSCSTPYFAGQSIPDLSMFQSQGNSIMEKWEKRFGTQPQFASSYDFNELNTPVVKKLLFERFGIFNFIVAPMQDEKGDLTGLLFVNNFKHLERSHLMVHIVANDISDYLQKIILRESNQLEPLTKLSNKIATQSQICGLLKAENKGTLFIIDIDNFKGLNDTLGHQVGDQAIVEFATCLRQVFRDTDVIGRIGGDEFMVFSPNLTSEKSVEKKAKQIVEKCYLHYNQGKIGSYISASVGICLVTDTNEKFESLYSKADCALYISKNNGKNQYHIYREKESVTYDENDRNTNEYLG